MKVKIHHIVPLFLLLFLLGNGMAFSQANNLVVIDQAFAQKEEVLSKLPYGTLVLYLKTTSNPWKDIREKMTLNPDLKNIHLFAESGHNSLLMGGIEYNTDTVASEFELAMLEGLYKGIHYQLLLYSCNLPSSPEGLDLIKELGNRTYFNIAAATGCTGVFDENFDFNFTTLDQPTVGPIFTN
ncbi:MAG: DUF4347 domain-containing protein [Sediminicola sp.]|tara:strand:+ start:2624 stop:3172 length:549 start_codon:yes stop_codon:yes gene_type:complete